MQPKIATSIDFSAEAPALIAAVHAAIAGRECVTLISPSDTEFGWVVCDEVELPAMTEAGTEGAVCETQGRKGRGDVEFAAAIVLAFLARF